MYYPCDLSQYEIIHEIGNSDCSSVYMARCILTNEIIALKMIDLDKCPISINSIETSIKLWSQLTCPNIIKYYGSFVIENRLYIVTEMMNQGSLIDILHFEYKKGIQDELLIASIMHEILIFLNSFHGSNHIHRNLEIKNIFADQTGNIKVGGFCKSSFHPRYQQLNQNQMCNKATELISDFIKYEQSIDIWSIGIIAYELATGKTSYLNLNSSLIQEENIYIQETIPKTVLHQKKYPSTKNYHEKNKSSSKKMYFTSQFQNFIDLCLHKDPKKRPSSAELLKHKFIQQAKGANYIYVNMLMQLPNFSLRISLKRPLKEIPTIHQVINQNKILFDFCGYDQCFETNLKNNDKSQKYDLIFDMKNIKCSTKKSLLSIPDSKYIKTNKTKCMKKGRFIITIPIQSETRE